MNGPNFTTQAWHDENLKHGGGNGHHCDCNEGLWVCEDCHEYSVCRCFQDRPFACLPLAITEIQQGLFQDL